jgi:hypothetical protein
LVPAAGDGFVIAVFVVFPKGIAAKERWYWSLHDDAGKVSSRLASANETKKTFK